MNKNIWLLASETAFKSWPLRHMLFQCLSKKAPPTDPTPTILHSQSKL